MITQLLVNRADITQCELQTLPVPGLADGDVLARTGWFALTANNITYAVVGDMVGYWQFYPVSDALGIVPVWGFADIIESRNAAVPVGTRIWGFLPMASHVVMQPGRASARGFVDAAPHRAALPAVYNQYVRTNDDPPELAAIADARSLLFPLFTTSWLIADYLADNGWFGAAQVIIGSASSKTGFGTAYFIRAQGESVPAVTALTSPANHDFVHALGFFDAVFAYDQVAAIDPSQPAVFVDMGGDAKVIAAVHHHMGDNLKASITVGATHWDARGKTSDLPGPVPSFFFAPTQIAKRDGEWGPGETMRRANAGNTALVAALGTQLTLSRTCGGEAIAQAYRAMVAGQTPPSQGVILTFDDQID